MVIRQGDIFWIDFGRGEGSGPAFLRPAVVVQNNLFNQSRINTVVVCAITSNLDRAKAPGNVLLHKFEAGLTKKSGVNVSQVYTVDKGDLSGKIGALTVHRLSEVLAGVGLVLTPAQLE